MRAFFLDWMHEFDGLAVEWELEEVDDTRVIAYIRMQGVGRMELYLDPAEGRRAVGLEP